jgi:serine acetyltransferase
MLYFTSMKTTIERRVTIANQSVIVTHKGRVISNSSIIRQCVTLSDHYIGTFLICRS